jgi:hypothetical protein
LAVELCPRGIVHTGNDLVRANMDEGCIIPGDYS